MPDLASFYVFPFMLIFFRLGAMILTAPGFSDSSINTRTRLIVAFTISAIMFPLLAEKMPPLPDQTGLMIYYIFAEIVMGICLSITARLFMGALSVAGELVAYMSGFQAATLFDPIGGANTTAPTLYMMIAAGALFFVSNFHHVLLLGVLESYKTFPAGSLPALEPTVAVIVQTVEDVFRVGVQISGPVMVTGFLGYVVLGVFNRLIPQLQVFFVALPVTVTLGLFMFALSLVVILGVFGVKLREHATVFDVEVTRH